MIIHYISHTHWLCSGEMNDRCILLDVCRWTWESGLAEWKCGILLLLHTPYRNVLVFKPISLKLIHMHIKQTVTYIILVQPWSVTICYLLDSFLSICPFSTQHQHTDSTKSRCVVYLLDCVIQIRILSIWYQSCSITMFNVNNIWTRPSSVGICVFYVEEYCVQKCNQLE